MPSETQLNYNMQVKNLTKLKELSKIEQSQKLGQINDLLKLPKIGSPEIIDREHVSFEESENILVT